MDTIVFWFWYRETTSNKDEKGISSHNTHTHTELIWGTELADISKLHFETVIQGDALPENINEINCSTLLDSIKVIRKSSSNEARRLLKAKAVKINGEVVSSEEVSLKSGDIVRVGKRDFARIVWRNYIWLVGKNFLPLSKT